MCLTTISWRWSRKRRAEVKDDFVLEYLNASSGTGVVPTATLRIRKADGHVVQEAACGDGPVDAATNAIDKVTGLKPKLVDYSLHAITSGKDAQGEVTVRLEESGLTILGRGASTDIIEASAKAYLNAINKLMQAKRTRREREINMGQTAMQKILAAHAGKKSVEPGEFILAKADLAMANDVTAPLAIKALGARRHHQALEQRPDRDRAFAFRARQGHPFGGAGGGRARVLQEVRHPASSSTKGAAGSSIRSFRSWGWSFRATS